MFKRFFIKYARAVSDENERKSLYRLYCIKTIALCIFYVLCLAVIVEALFIGDAMSADDGNWLPFIIFGITLLLWFASALSALAFWFSFRISYHRILNRAPMENEMPEVISYRQKTKDSKKSFLKSFWWAVVLLVMGTICMFILITVDVIQNPDSEDLTLLSDVGIGIFAVCLGIFMFSLLFIQMKRTSEGKTVEMKTEKEAKVIDAAQGRKHRYSLAEDNNAQSYRYLFPNGKLYIQAEALRAKQLNAALIAVMLLCIVGIAVALIFFSPIVFDWKLEGFAFPVFMTITFVGTFVVILPYSVRQMTLEKRQKEELETYPVYEKNLALYRKYEAFSKGKGRILYIFIFTAFVLAFALAIAFPDKLWSLFSVVPLFLGIALNSKLISDLRKEALPIEEEIDRICTEIKFRVSTEEISEDNLNTEIVYYHDALFGKKADECFTCYFHLGQTHICLGMDNKSKRIGELSAAFLREVVEVNYIDIPTTYTAGVLYLDSVLEYPSFFKQTITFDAYSAYDSQNRILQLGKPMENGLVYKIFKNGYVQLSENGHLTCIWITNISFIESNQKIGLTQYLESIKQIYQVSYTDVVKKLRGDYYTLSFYFQEHEIIIETNVDRILGTYTDITVKRNPKSEPTQFWLLYAYYENKSFHLHCDKEELTEYLNVLKSYIKEDKVFYEEYDVPNQKRYFYLDGVKREVPFLVDGDFKKEMTNLFGSEAFKIIDNRPKAH